jgi:hypothetical protein
MGAFVMNREPAVAGSFYPGDPKQLHLMLDQYLNDCESVAKVPKALIVRKRSIFSVIHNTQSVMSDYPKDNFFGVTDGIDRKNTRSRFLETSPRAMARVWIIPGKILSAAVIAPTPV